MWWLLRNILGKPPENIDLLRKITRSEAWKKIVVFSEIRGKVFKTQNTEILMFSVFFDKAVVKISRFLLWKLSEDRNSDIYNPLRMKNKIKRNASLSQKLKRRFAPCYFPKSTVQYLWFDLVICYFFKNSNVLLLRDNSHIFDSIFSKHAFSLSHDCWLVLRGKKW